MADTIVYYLNKNLITFNTYVIRILLHNMNATIGYFIGFSIGCIAMFIAIKLEFSSIAKMILLFSLLIGSVIVSFVGDEE